jgi:hypothetical protein
MEVSWMKTLCQWVITVIWQETGIKLDQYHSICEILVVSILSLQMSVDCRYKRHLLSTIILCWLQSFFFLLLGCDPAAVATNYQESFNVYYCYQVCLNTGCSIWLYRRLYMHASPVQNGLKQGDALSLLLFSFASEYTIRKVQYEFRIEWDTTSGLCWWW